MQKYIEVLNTYKEYPNLTKFNILHIYPLHLTLSDGIDGYRFCSVVGYNRDLKLKRDLGVHDEIRPESNLIDQIAIYGDKSTIITFKYEVTISQLNTQTLYIED